MGDLILGIDASTVGSGGAKRHLVEILNCYDPFVYGFSKIKIWGSSALLDNIPDAPHLTKISHKLLNKGLVFRSIWQMFYRDRQFQNEMDILFNPFGTYTGHFRPYATMSRNMLVFDRTEQRRFGISWYRLKFILLFYVQRRSFRNAQGLIFISRYAMNTIAKYVDYSRVRTAVIHHGISQMFAKTPVVQQPRAMYDKKNPFQFLYVSTVFDYKHQLNVIEAVARLRAKNFDVVLKLVGGVGQHTTGALLASRIAELDPGEEFISWMQNVGLNEVVQYYHSSDAFIFASSCENMPNILLEAMASGLPIACSSKPPMPEFLDDGGLYFDPADTHALELVLEKMLNDTQLRTTLSSRSYNISKKYSWRLCADQTFNFLFSLLKDN